MRHNVCGNLIRMSTETATTQRPRWPLVAPPWVFANQFFSEFFDAIPRSLQMN
jgi:hypothetical protein